VYTLLKRELGLIEPILKIAGALREFKKSSNLSIATYPYLLVDASQSVLFEDVSIERLKADLLVVDGIKMYGPRGVGVLVVKNGTKISPIILGGGQEGGLRSGTENVPAICGLAKALEIAVEKRKTETTRLKKLRDYAIKKTLGTMGVQLLADNIHAWLAGTLKATPQNHEAATYSKKFTKADGEIQLTDDPYKIFRTFQAYSVWPSVYFFLPRSGRIKITALTYDRATHRLHELLLSQSDHVQGYLFFSPPLYITSVQWDVRKIFRQWLP
jgi:hypothetical protein